MRKTWIFTLLAVFVMFGSASAQEKADKSEKAKQHGFIGAEKCKTCHRTAKQGEQYRIWQEGPHAKAYETLATDVAKKYAAERKIENAQTAAECLKCHVTAYGVDKQYLGEKYAITDGVGCESCHGAGADYYKMTTMKSITAGEMDGASVGLVMPDEKVCITCHNEESPAFKGFKFVEMVKKIAHPIPEAPKTE